MAFGRDDERDQRGLPRHARGLQRDGAVYDLGDRNPSQGFTGGYGGQVSDRHVDDAGGAYAASRDPRVDGPWHDGTRPDFTGRGPRGWRYSDARIEEDVCDALMRDPRIDASDIEVEVTDGDVTLRGEVESRALKRLVEDVVAERRGVYDVHNGLRVREDSSVPRNRSLGAYDRDRAMW